MLSRQIISVGMQWNGKVPRRLQMAMAGPASRLQRSFFGADFRRIGLPGAAEIWRRFQPIDRAAARHPTQHKWHGVAVADRFGDVLAQRSHAPSGRGIVSDKKVDLVRMGSVELTSYVLKTFERFEAHYSLVSAPHVANNT